MLSLNFSPFPVLETEHLLLRNIQLQDAQELFLMRTDKKVMEWIDREPFVSVSEAALFIEKILDWQNENESILWVICLKDNPAKLIGTIGFWRIQKEHYRAEIGYMLQKAYWNRGIMKAALKVCIQHGFAELKFHSIEANINPENKASAALLKSCGFVQEAYFRENYYFNGVFKDSAIFSLVDQNTGPRV